jgi:hypothetical protein
MNHYHEDTRKDAGLKLQLTLDEIPKTSISKQHIHTVPLTTPVNPSGSGAGGYPPLNKAYGDNNGKCTQQYVQRRCHEKL